MPPITLIQAPATNQHGLTQLRYMDRAALDEIIFVSDTNPLSRNAIASPWVATVAEACNSGNPLYSWGKQS